jgi:hypothetical protein
MQQTIQQTAFMKKQMKSVRVGNVVSLHRMQQTIQQTAFMKKQMKSVRVGNVVRNVDAVPKRRPRHESHQRQQTVFTKNQFQPATIQLWRVPLSHAASAVQRSGISET